MNKQTITFRMDKSKKKELEIIATQMDRDRSYVLNEAVSYYIDVHHWQTDHIKEGIRQANAGEFAKDSEVAAAFAKLRSK